MTSIEIKKGVPIPKTKPGRLPKYPLAEMEVGDCFSVPNDQGKTPRGLSKRQQRVSALCATRAKRHPGTKFTTRMIDGEVWCWRIS